MIRSFEDDHPGVGLSFRAACNGRVPIFAVSASLVKKDQQLYVGGSFDGWILKPIDFKRLSTWLVGIVNEVIRGSCLYEHGACKRGGWFKAATDRALTLMKMPEFFSSLGSSVSNFSVYKLNYIHYMYTPQCVCPGVCPPQCICGNPPI